jgi:hypothetical protein
MAGSTGYRLPAIIIGEAVWLPVRFTLSLRDVAVCVAEPTSISAVGPTADTVICLMRDLRSFEVHRDCRVAHEVSR